MELMTIKETEEESIRYHCDDNGLVIAESDSTDTVTAQNIWGHKPLARKSAVTIIHPNFYDSTRWRGEIILFFRTGGFHLLIAIIITIALFKIGKSLKEKNIERNSPGRIIGISLIVFSIVSLPISCILSLGPIKHKQEIDVKPITDLQLSNNVDSLIEILRSLSSTEIDAGQYNIGSISDHLLAAESNKPNKPFNNMRIEVEDGIKKDTGDSAFGGIKEKMVCNSSNVEMTVILFYGLGSAREYYESEIRSGSGYNYGICKKGGSKDNRYFYTFLNQSREDSGGCWTLTNQFTSITVFQKENIMIKLQEGTDDKNDRHTNEYIKVVAESLKKLEQ
jgi:hypothetical protein